MALSQINAQIIESVTPTSGEQGESLTITINGSGTHFQTATGTNVWLDKGVDVITPTNIGISSEVLMTANLVLSSTEPIGAYNVNVFNYIDDTITLADGFTVTIIDDIAYNSKNISLNIYPNPSNDHIYINADLTSYQDIQIKIFNTNGVIVMNEDMTMTNTINKKIDISKLSRGVYYLSIQAGNNNYTKRIIKK
jgi:hypothetical protein